MGKSKILIKLCEEKNMYTFISIITINEQVKKKKKQIKLVAPHESLVAFYICNKIEYKENEEKEERP